MAENIQEGVVEEERDVSEDEIITARDEMEKLHLLNSFPLEVS